MNNKPILHLSISLNFFRNAYTARILEIISNIKKQKTDIDKILQDTWELQKEINTINGQLDRQFTVTDDLLFKVSKIEDDFPYIPPFTFAINFTVSPPLFSASVENLLNVS